MCPSIIIRSKFFLIYSSSINTLIYSVKIFFKENLDSSINSDSPCLNKIFPEILRVPLLGSISILSPSFSLNLETTSSFTEVNFAIVCFVSVNSLFS